jgi:hypothetical protein
MAKRFTPSTVLDEAAKIKQMWLENPSFTVPAPRPDSPVITAAEHMARAVQMQTKDAEIDAAKAHLAGLIEERDGMATELNAWNVRIRRGVGFTFGLESPQYKMVGGTPPSERKPRTVKPKPAV